MKKRWLCFILALCIFLSCAGCASRRPEAAEAPASKPEPQAELPDVAVSPFGSVDGETYENAMLGYGCKLAGWHFYEEDRLTEINGFAKDRTSPETAFADGSMVLDMSAESENGMENVNVQLQDMRQSDGEVRTEEKLIDAILPTLPQTFQDAGYESVKIEKESIALGGDSHVCLSITGEIQGISVRQKQVVVSCGNYMAYITATAYLSERPDDILQQFYKL